MLPVYSVGSEKEAQRLLILACPTNSNGEFIDRYTAREQTLENLELFSNDLDRAHDLLVKNEHCDCLGD